jgi:uncharacterized oligopeptide transporter (OPT) family protein
VPGATARTPLLAPQANIMATVVQGVMDANLPWAPIIVGAMIALAVELLGIGSLPVAIGLYLPLSLSAPIMAGGLVSLIIARLSRTEEQLRRRREGGILFSSGLVAGDALIGVAVAFMIGGWPSYMEYYDAHEGMWNTVTGSFGPYLSLIMFAGLVVVVGILAHRGLGRKSNL